MTYEPEIGRGPCSSEGGAKGLPGSMLVLFYGSIGQDVRSSKAGAVPDPLGATRSGFDVRREVLAGKGGAGGDEVCG